jgi:hypothetical protein
MEGIRKLYAGDFNTMSQKQQPDGSVIVTLRKDGEDKAYRFRVRDLYGPDETVLEHEVIEAKAPQHILDRMKEAKEHGS